MKASKAEQDIVVGIDVSKASLEVGVVPSGESWCTGQSPAEVNGLADRIAELQPAVVVCEATGGMELGIVYALIERGVPVHRCEPKRARYFARSLGLLAKTDRIDAFVLARFGATGELAAQSFPDAQARRLDALTTRRRQLVEAITAETNRLQATTDPAARASIEQHLAQGRAQGVGRPDRALRGRLPGHPGQGATHAQRARRRSSDRHRAGQRTARVGRAGPLGGCRAHWHCAPQQRQRQAPRKTPHLGRAQGRALCPVHGRPGRQPP